jgi:hypothetical protein
MADGKLVMYIIVFIVIVIAIMYFMNGSGFYDGAIFDYTMPPVYEFTNVPGIVYENGMPFGHRAGWGGNELRRAAAVSETMALRDAASVHEAKRRAAEFREAAAARDMKREEHIKLAAEAEARALQNAAARHESLAKMQGDLASRAMNVATNAGLAADNYDAMKIQQMQLARSEHGLERDRMLDAAFRYVPRFRRGAYELEPGRCGGRTMLMN